MKKKSAHFMCFLLCSVSLALVFCFSGIAYATAPLLPGVIKHHASLGVTKTMGNQELKLALVHAFSNSVTGPNPLEVPGQQKIKIKMNQWEFSVGYAWKF